MFVQYRIHAALQKGPEGMKALLLSHMDWNLNLTGEQHAKVEVVLSDATLELLQLRSEVQPRLDDIMGRAESRVHALLNPDQQKKFEQSVRERKQFWIHQNRALINKSIPANSGGNSSHTPNALQK